jgi:hypothetical protein
MPLQLYLADVEFEDEPSAVGGGYGDIHFGTYGGAKVAIKRPRHSNSKDRQRTAKVRMHHL